MIVKRWVKYLLSAVMAILIVGCNANKINNLETTENISLDSKKAVKVRIIKEAKKQGLNPILALSVAKQESDFEKTAKSYVGAIGVFQLMPATAKDLGVNPYKPEENIKGGIKYLKALKEQFGSTKLALAAYNAGPGAVQRYNGVPPYSETRIYVRNILGYYEYYSKNPNAVMVE